MSTRARSVTRSLLAGLAIVGLLAACGGDDDDSADDTTTTTEADQGTDDGATDEGTVDEALDVCSLLDLASINSITGETFTQTHPEDNACTVVNDASTAVLNVQVHVIEGEAERATFLSGAESICDEGTVREDLDFSYADGEGFGCFSDGKAAVGVDHDGAVGLIVGQPSTEVPDDALFAALAQILQDLATA